MAQDEGLQDGRKPVLKIELFVRVNSWFHGFDPS
jgi:hypothetical protein